MGEQMKVIFGTCLINLFLTLSFNGTMAYADNAFYMVPTTKPELVKHSRFMVEIVNAYKGPQTQKIAYAFPEILTGEKHRVLEFQRIAGTENSWQAPEAKAHCTTTDNIFSCNIHLEKSNTTVISPVEGSELNPLLLSRKKALQNLSNIKDLLPEDMQSLTEIINGFHLGEPAGILVYEI